MSPISTRAQAWSCSACSMLLVSAGWLAAIGTLGAGVSGAHGPCSAHSQVWLEGSRMITTRPMKTCPGGNMRSNITGSLTDATSRPAFVSWVSGSRPGCHMKLSVAGATTRSASPTSGPWSLTRAVPRSARAAVAETSALAATRVADPAVWRRRSWTCICEDCSAGPPATVIEEVHPASHGTFVLRALGGHECSALAPGHGKHTVT